jgi:hypothetical protein
MRDSGLALFEWTFQSATAHFGFGRDERKHSQSHGIGERAKYGGSLSSFSF